MPEEVAPGTVPENATPTEESGIPTDFREYVRWRNTGELPEKQPSAAAAEEEPSQAKTEPNSETVDQQEPAEEEEDEAGDETAQTKRPGARQRRIDRLTKELDELRQQVEQQRQQQPPEKKAAAPAEPAGKPKLANFETLEAYQEALTDWKLDQREQKSQQEAANKKAQEAAEQLQRDWSAREKAARKAHPDYDNVIDTVEAPTGPGVLAARQAMLEDEAGAEILYYLGKNPAELKRIAALSPIGAVKEIGKLSAILGKSSQVPVNGKPAVSTAPRPPSPVSRLGKTTTDSIDDPEVQRDYKRWEKARRAQLKG